MKLIPSNTKVDRHLGHFIAKSLLDQGYNYLIVHLSPESSSYNIIVDKFTTHIRQRSITPPNLLMTVFNKFEPQPVFTKLISQDYLFFELTLNNFDYIWNSYWAIIETTSCYQKNISSFMGFIYLSYPDSTMNEYFWPIIPNKGYKYQFALTRHKININATINNKPKILLYFDPDCSYNLSIKFTITTSIAQLLKHYFILLIPMSISILILILSIQFSNICNRYTFNNWNLEQFKNKFVQSDCYESKCFMILKAQEIMVNYHYFTFCFVQIIFGAFVTLFLIKR